MEVVFSNHANVLNTKLLTAHDGAAIYTVKTTQHSLFGGREVTYLTDMNPCSETTRRRSVRHAFARGQGRGREASYGERKEKEEGVVVGLINWKKRIIEVGGKRRSIDDVRRKISGKAFSLSIKGSSAQADPEEEESSSEGRERIGFPGLSSLRLPSFKVEKGVKKSEVWQWNDGHDQYDFIHQDQGWEIVNRSSSTPSGKLNVPYRPHIFGKPKPVTLELSPEALRKDEVFLLLALIYSEAKRQEKTNHVASAGW